MSHSFLLSFFGLLLIAVNAGKTAPASVAAEEQICGKWQNQEKNLIVQVFKEDSQFKAKIVWFNNGAGDKAMESWTDKHNPDPALRNRKLLGMNVLEKLVYKPETNSWEDGMIYDAQAGKHWNSSAYINNEGALKVKGYWHFKFIGRTMTFNRI
ncbi:DUF2147 domain-containing protein [Mucilaginibacter psychrotolerans]|uniref:DUF2147 domain-containing protein n=1 Tax=Mucilaginibacter psychrotolerans TaxID=1524096 RepID=A0A4Y8S8G6_9SPHI|nr:DUF2147 domain-containing protein [Mucilaginibacter psychrotolerans]TFF35373.1 DUF2147 domain-containing protein [Mucilaginibacter psychrotolerans]